MSDIPESFHHYLAAWNDADGTGVRALLERSVTQNVLFVDPANTARGIDALEALIVEARNTRPTAAYVRTSGVDGHNHRYRYRWEARLGDGLVVPGMDVTTTDPDGAIVQIDGFFGEFPPLED